MRLSLPLFLSVATLAGAAPAPWVPDLGDGTYKKPVLFADYSDPAAGDRWIGAKLGLIATTASGATQPGHADFDWFRVTPTANPGKTPN